MIRSASFLIALFSVVVAGLSPFASGRASAAQGSIVGLSEVPEEIRQAADNAAGKIRWIAAYHFEAPFDWYRLAGMSEKNRFVMVNVRATGTVMEVRGQLPIGDVPQQVLRFAEHKYPDFKPTKAESIGKTLPAVLGYELEGTENGARLRIAVTADGRNAGRLGPDGKLIQD